MTAFDSVFSPVLDFSSECECETASCDCCDRVACADSFEPSGDGYQICRPCIDSGNYARCHWSGHLYHIEDLVETRHYQGYDLPQFVTILNEWDRYAGNYLLIVCQSIIDSEFYSCYSCDEYDLNDNSIRTANDRDICSRCFEYSYFSCDECQEIFHESDRHGDCCESCDRDYRSYRIRPYSTDVLEHLNFVGRPVDGIFYGIELEVNCDNYRASDKAEECINILGKDFVIAKEDGSIGSGFELVTAPATLDEHKIRWSEFLGDSKPHDITSWQSGRCGMHVHVSRKPLSELQIGKIVVFVNCSENESFIRTIAGRYADSWCQIDHDKKLTAGKRCGDSRYEAVNLTNSATIEFRIFRGTLHRTHFLANLEFCHAVINYCQICGLRELHYSDFMVWVRSQPRLLYSNLVSYLSDKGF